VENVEVRVGMVARGRLTLIDDPLDGAVR